MKWVQKTDSASYTDYGFFILYNEDKSLSFRIIIHQLDRPIYKEMSFKPIDPNLIEAEIICDDHMKEILMKAVEQNGITARYIGDNMVVFK